MNEKDAVRQFVAQEFNNIPLSLVEKAYPELFEKILPLVEPQIDEYELNDDEEPIEPSRDDYEREDDYQLALEEYEEHKEKYEEYTQAYEEWERTQNDGDYYPMWGTIFECSSWVSSFVRENLREIQDLGFIVMDDFDELDVCLGVAGAGYSFYDVHWTPLYHLMGLQWHNSKDEE